MADKRNAMKIKSVLFVAVLLAIPAFLPSVKAVPINITTSGGALVSAAPKSDLGDFGDATVLNWLTADVLSYNSITASSLGSPISVLGQIGQTSGTGGNSITLNVTGFSYLFLHWGGQGGGWAQAFYVGNSAGSFNFNNSLVGTGQNPSVGGLSFYSFYNSNNVPDGGSTVMMLGAALSGLSLVVRRFKK